MTQASNQRKANTMSTRKRWRIEITQEIINVATERDSGHCIVADALRASIPGATMVSVDLQTIRWSDTTARKRYICLTPHPAQQLLVDFDQGKRDRITPCALYVRPAQIINMRKRTAKDAETKRERRKVRASEKRELQGGDTGRVPVVVGGHAPPTAALSSARGRIRRYGVKSLQP